MRVCQEFFSFMWELNAEQKFGSRFVEIIIPSLVLSFYDWHFSMMNYINYRISINLAL